MNVWIKSLITGFIGALIMFILMMIGIKGTGIAPFNMPPSAAFLKSIGLPTKPLAPVLHFLYGGIWSIIFYALFKNKTSIIKGIALAGGLWLIMMLIYSPVIGWGVFGTSAGSLPADNPLALSATPKYIIATLVLHLIYGLIVGWLHNAWVIKSQQQSKHYSYSTQ